MDMKNALEVYLEKAGSLASQKQGYRYLSVLDSFSNYGFLRSFG